MTWVRKKSVKPPVPPTNIPAYVDRERGAAELSITPKLWDEWVTEGRLPRPAPGFPHSVPRWRWEDVDRCMSKPYFARPELNPAVVAAAGFGSYGRSRRRKTIPSDESK
jgi:hypothetical protein